MTPASTLEPNHPARLLWGSQRYLASQFSVIPWEDGLYLVGYAYGQHRTLYGILDRHDLIELFETDFAKAALAAKQQQEHAAAIAAERDVLEQELSELNLEIEL